MINSEIDKKLTFIDLKMNKMLKINGQKFTKFRQREYILYYSIVKKITMLDIYKKK